MARKVFLHIGVMKSGTSFLQDTLAGNRTRLREHGVLAVRDVLDLHREGVPTPGSRGAWRRLVEEIRAWPATAVVSMEFLGPSGPARIARVVEGLSFAEVHVVMTVRDLGRTVPAMWQESLKNYGTVAWDEYVRAVAEGDRSVPGPAQAFWRQHAVAGMAHRWMAAVGPERFTLVTVPPAGADPLTLWRRFCVVVGLDPDCCEMGRRRNDSLGAMSAQVLRALNLELHSRGVPRPVFNRLVKHGPVVRHLAARKGDEPPIGFDQDWVHPRADRILTRLHRLGPRVVGDLEELRPVPVPGIDPTTLPADEVLAATAALAADLGLDQMGWPAPAEGE